MPTPLPPIDDLTGASRTQGQIKTWFGSMREYLTGLLGEDGAAATALAALGALQPGTTANLTKGFTNTAHNYGTASSGTITVDFAEGAQAYYTNNGAHTLAPPGSTEGGQDTLLTNGASAGAITTSGWDDVEGDDLTTTNGHRFLLSARRINARSMLFIAALQ